MSFAIPSRSSPRCKALYQLATAYLSGFISYFSLVPSAPSTLAAFCSSFLSRDLRISHFLCLEWSPPRSLHGRFLLIIQVAEALFLPILPKIVPFPQPQHSVLHHFIFLFTYHYLKLFCLPVYRKITCLLVYCLSLLLDCWMNEGRGPRAIIGISLGPIIPLQPLCLDYDPTLWE